MSALLPLIVAGAGMMVAGALMRRRDGAEPEGLTVGVTDHEALARVLTSEAGNGPVAERLAIGWTVRNRARKTKKTIAELVCAPCGEQGSRDTAGRKRPFSSRQEATKPNLLLAAQVLTSPQSADPTGGATSFFEPRAQDLFVKKGLPGYSRTAAEVRAKWLAGGAKPKGTVGRFEFFA